MFNILLCDPLQQSCEAVIVLILQMKKLPEDLSGFSCLSGSGGIFTSSQVIPCEEKPIAPFLFCHDKIPYMY